MDETTSSVYRLLMGLIVLTSPPPPPPPPPPTPTLTLSEVSFQFPVITYDARPEVTATSTLVTSLLWILYRYIDGLNDEIVDGGSVSEPTGTDKITSFQPTQFNQRYYFIVEGLTSGAPIIVTSSLSPINNGGF
jgi:hypothetical protein